MKRERIERIIVFSFFLFISNIGYAEAAISEADCFDRFDIAVPTVIICSIFIGVICGFSHLKAVSKIPIAEISDKKKKVDIKWRFLTFMFSLVLPVFSLLWFIPCLNSLGERLSWVFIWGVLVTASFYLAVGLSSFIYHKKRIKLIIPAKGVTNE